MNQFKYNATNGGSPRRIPNAQHIDPRIINYLNSPLTINCPDPRIGSSVLPNQLHQSNVGLYDHRQVYRNLQVNLPQPPPNLNMSNFPRFNRSLSNARQINNHTIQNGNTVFPNTVSSNNGLKTRSLNDLFSTKTKPKKNGFKVSHDDFPALPENTRPCQQNLAPTSSDESEPIQFTCPPESKPETHEFDKVVGPPPRNLKTDPIPKEIPEETKSTSNQSSSASTSKTYMKVSSDGRVSNIPESMLRDQYGIAGELMSMTLATEIPQLVELNLGRNLCDMGLNLNSPENIHPSFAGPFSDLPLPPHRQEANVPDVFLVSKHIKLPELSVKMLDMDLIFYLFYNYYQDETQLYAANKLHERGWAYHKIHRVWMLLDLSEQALSEDKKQLSGEFFVFDYMLWRVVKKILTINISDLELTNSGT